MQIIIFIIILAALVLVHEGGHMLVGKRCGIDVTEFSFGLGPTVWSIERGGTKYSIKALPFGGLCQFRGSDLDSDDEEEFDDSPGSFHHASVWARIATVFAGPFMNFVLAFFLSLFVIGSIGYDEPVINEVMEGYPADEAGLRAGDEIIRINNKKIDLYGDISLYMMLNEDKEALITYKRDGEVRTATLLPRYDPESGRYLFGLIGSGKHVKGGVFTTIKYSLIEVRYWIEATWKSLGMLLHGRVSRDDIAGPVGVAKTVGDVYEESKPDGVFYIWINMMVLTVLLSANLGVMNLLPLPALDGGRLVFLILEAALRRPLNRKIEAMIHFAGICALMVLMVFVMFNDITRFFR